MKITIEDAEKFPGLVVRIATNGDIEMSSVAKYQARPPFKVCFTETEPQTREQRPSVVQESAL